MSSDEDLTAGIVDKNDPGGLIDLSLYRRIPRPLQHLPSRPNEIYIRSQRSGIPLHKRITKLFFDEQYPAVIIHAAGKNIFQAVKVATDFCDANTPWFQTHVITSSEVVYDDYEPLVSRIPASLSSKQVIPSREEVVSDESHHNENGELSHKPKKPRISTIPKQSAHDPVQDTLVSLNEASSTADGSLVPAMSFFRCRIISAIHITITKTEVGQTYVK